MALTGKLRGCVLITREKINRAIHFSQFSLDRPDVLTFGTP